MISTKTLKIIIEKPYDYKPIPELEVEQVRSYITQEVIELANRFDGPSTLHIRIQIKAKGNA